MSKFMSGKNTHVYWFKNKRVWAEKIGKNEKVLIHTSFSIVLCEFQNNQLLLLRQLRTRSSSKKLLSKKYWCGIYSFIYTFIVLRDFRDIRGHSNMYLLSYENKVWVAENLTKHSSVLLLSLVRFSTTQTLIVFYVKLQKSLLERLNLILLNYGILEYLLLLFYYLMLYRPWNWIHFYLEQLYMYDVSMYIL